MNRFRIVTKTLVNRNHFFNVFVPQKRFLLFFWRSIRCDDGVVAYDTRAEAANFLTAYAANGEAVPF